MEKDEIVAQARALAKRLESYAPESRPENPNGSVAHAARAQVVEFFRQYTGRESSFTQAAEAANGYNAYLVRTLVATLDSFVEYVGAGLAYGISAERKAQIDVVSDFLGQAEAMLANSAFHPAAAAVLVGASLEEFLRTWVEDEKLPFPARPSLDSLAGALRTADLISKQDVKDIVSWTGLRNDAAHGQWDKVGDGERVRLMLAGVNLFLRQHSGPSK
jgi:hypothetical protein